MNLKLGEQSNLEAQREAGQALSDRLQIRNKSCTLIEFPEHNEAWCSAKEGSLSCCAYDVLLFLFYFLKHSLIQHKICENIAKI